MGEADPLISEAKSSESRGGVKLKNELGILRTFACAVTVLAGSSVYLSPGLVARQTNNMGVALLAWIASGIICLIGGLCFCELALALKKSGGQYIFFKETFGDLAGFCLIWTQTFITFPTGLSLSAATLADYCVAPFFDTGSFYWAWLVKSVAVLSIFICFLINCVSVSFVSKTQVFFLIIQMLGPVFFIAIGFWKVSTGSTSNYETMFDNGNRLDVARLSIALYSCMVALEGWGYICTITEEMSNSARVLPISTVASILFVSAFYVLTNLAFMSALSHNEMAKSAAVATIFVEKTLGNKVSFIVPILSTLSCFGSLNAQFFTVSRTLLSASREGHLPEPLAYIHRKRRTPIPALVILFFITTAWSVAFADNVEVFVTFFLFSLWVCYGFTFVAIFVLRIQRPNLPRPYKVWIASPIFMGVCSLFLIVAPFVRETLKSSIALATMLTALPLYFICANSHKWIPVNAGSFKGRVYQNLMNLFNLLPCIYEEETDGMNLGSNKIANPNDKFVS